MFLFYMATYRIKRFNETREKVPSSKLQESWHSGVIQKDSNGDWRIINRQKGVYWNAHYDSREKAEAALRGYHSNK